MTLKTAALPLAVQKQVRSGQTVIGPQKGPQTKFLQSRADITIFGGAGGGGKTFGTLLYPSRHFGVDGYQSVIFRRTYKRIMMSGGIWDETHKVYPLLGGTANEGKLIWKFEREGSRATVSFNHLQHTSDMYNYKGLQAAHIGFEELTEFDEVQFFYLKSRCRSTCGVKPTMTGTTNPDADSWVKRFLAPWVDENWPEEDRAQSGELRHFIREDDAIKWLPKGKRHPDATSVRFIVSTIYDNKILMETDPDYERGLKALPFVEMQRMLHGDWSIRRAGGKLFKKHWFKIVDAIPGEVKRVVRGWDLAATEEKDDEKKSGPDFTAGVKVGLLANGQYIILDALRMRETPKKVDEAVKNTASHDGKRTSIFMEQEPGSSGVRTIADFSTMLAGYDFHGIRSTGSKTERARGPSSQAENGNVLMLRAHWNEDFLNELEAFPDERVHDDWTDAFDLCMNQLFTVGPEDLTDEVKQRIAAKEKIRAQLSETFW